ncbi:MAG: tryptophan synthase subunit alpha [Actinomycetota bacterium]|nr:tryptophan synthase subunit alpha [Actinomycetota bacterium]
MTQVSSDPLIARTDAASRGRPLLICYLPVGDPKTPSASVARYIDCGVDVIEAGIGVSDPALDGDVIRDSMHRCVAAGVVGRRAADALAQQLSAGNRPAAVWMSYAEQLDDDYLEMVSASGARGVLLPGTAPAALAAALATAPSGGSLSVIPFLDHRPTAAQIDAACDAPAYAMLAAAAGVTGTRDLVGQDNAAILAGLRDKGVTAPIVLGFGIGTAGQARRAIELGADGVVVGTACVRAALDGPSTLTAVLSDLRRTLDG